MKWKFINHQLIVDTINAAFQRANIYQDPLNVSDPNRKELREELEEQLIQLSKKYTSAVTDAQHCQNIEYLANKLTEMFRQSDLLEGKKFRIGIAQKALNLYLKYLWCLGRIETPPHCPFDSVVIAELWLFLSKQPKQEKKKKINWTEMDSIDDYKELVRIGRELICGTKYKNLAEWELDVWQEHLNSL